MTGMELQSYLPYLVNRVGHRFVVEFTPVLDRVGLDIGMWRVLATLAECGCQPVGELSHGVSINISTLSRLLGRMQKKGLIVRCRSGSDARTVLVSLTKKGSEMAASLLPDALALEDRAAADFSPDELSLLRQLLTRLYAGQCRAQSLKRPLPGQAESPVNCEGPEPGPCTTPACNHEIEGKRHSTQYIEIADP